MTAKRGWEEAAEELGLHVDELSDLGMPSALSGKVGGFPIEIIHDPDSIRDTRARIALVIPGRVSESVFSIGPYNPPHNRIPAFHRPVITADPPFNIRFSIDVSDEDRAGALEFLDGRRRSLLMALQSVTPQLSMSASPEGGRLECWSDRRPSGDNLVRIVRAKVRVAEAIVTPAPVEEASA